MGKRNAGRQMDSLIMNNCKIANELRKYRDLAGCLNQVSLSGERVREPNQSADYAEYYISQELTYLDMMTANAVYTLMVNCAPGEEFQAETVAQIMAGNPAWRLAEKRRGALEQRLQKLAQTQLYILADHDHQVGQDLYEGPFLPVEWESAGSRLRFHFRRERQMPLYQYAEHHRQLIKVPFRCLRDDGNDGQISHNNNDRVLALRHYLLQELEILRYEKNKVEELPIRLLKRDREGNELGLLWTLGIVEDGQKQQEKNRAGVARKVHKLIGELMDNWRKSGYLEGIQYEMISPENGFGVYIKMEKQK